MSDTPSRRLPKVTEIGSGSHLLCGTQQQSSANQCLQVEQIGKRQGPRRKRQNTELQEWRYSHQRHVSHGHNGTSVQSGLLGTHLCTDVCHILKVHFSLVCVLRNSYRVKISSSDILKKGQIPSSDLLRPSYKETNTFTLVHTNPILPSCLAQSIHNSFIQSQ